MVHLFHEIPYNPDKEKRSLTIVGDNFKAFIDSNELDKMGSQPSKDDSEKYVKYELSQLLNDKRNSELRKSVKSILEDSSKSDDAKRSELFPLITQIVDRICDETSPYRNLKFILMNVKYLD